MTKRDEIALTDADLKRILSHAAHISAGQGGTQYGRKIIDIISDRVGRTTVEDLATNIDLPTIHAPSKDAADTTTTIRAQANTISLHPCLDGSWELTCRGQADQSVNIRVSHKKGTLTELLDELEETA